MGMIEGRDWDPKKAELRELQIYQIEAVKMIFCLRSHAKQGKKIFTRKDTSFRCDSLIRDIVL